MMKSKTKINLACGESFIPGAGWINLDFSPSNANVRRANLLGRLPSPNDGAGLVYSSHFLEHIPRGRVPSFLAECHRILAPGGVLRLVLPDMEELCRSYLTHRERGEHAQADFVVLEMIDQCVRQESGGELGRFYTRLKSATALSQAMFDFIRERTGEDLAAPVGERRTLLGGGRLLRAVRSRLQRLWVRAVLRLLPTAFRTQNVSLAAVGERHQWLWDYHQLHAALAEVGFTDIVRRTADTSGFEGFPFHPLDLDASGRPRKGAESMFIEARKPV